jgi:hypothetical protein
VYLVISPAIDVVEQAFSIDTAYRLCLKRIASWIYLHNVGDSDTFRFRLRNETDNYLVCEKELTGAEIKSSLNATQAYSHGKLFLDFDDDVLIGRGRYSFVAEQLTGFSTTTFLALCKDWESPYFRLDSTPAGDWSDPYYLRLYDQEGREIS